MDQPKIYTSLDELKADVRQRVLAELAEIRGQELSDDDISVLAERFRGCPPETKVSLQLELVRLRALHEAAVSYGKQEDADRLKVWMDALEWRVAAKSAKREYPNRAGPRWAVLNDLGYRTVADGDTPPPNEVRIRPVFGPYTAQMSTTRSRALVSLLTHLTLGVGEFPGVDYRISTVEDVIEAERKAILSLRSRLPVFLNSVRNAMPFYAELDRQRLTPEQLEQLEMQSARMRDPEE